MNAMSNSSAQITSQKFFSRYRKIVFATFAGIVSITLTIILLVGNLELEKERQRLYFELNERSDSLNSLLNVTLNHLELMRKGAESFMANPMRPKPKTPYSSSLKPTPTGILSIESDPSGYDKKDYGNITSMFNANEVTSAIRDEMEMAMSLNPAFSAVKQNIPNMAWVYYLSKSKFINLYPWTSYKDFALKEEVYTHEFYTHGLPEKNPTRIRFWTPAYVDEAGKGLMVTASIPVYEKNTFLGTISIDLTVDFLNAFVSQIAAESGTILIFNEYDQLLAHPTLISSKDKIVRKLEEALPQEILSVVGNLRNAKTLKRVSTSNHEVFAEKIPNANWTLLYYKEKTPFYKFAFTPFGASFLTLAVIFFAIFLFLGKVVADDFIDPSKNLIKYIEEESVSSKSIPIPTNIPSVWLSWFQKVSEIFSDNRNLILDLKEILLNLEQKVEERTLELQKANNKNEELLLNILPKEIVSELKTSGRSAPVFIKESTILFTDFVDFSKYAATIEPQILVSELDEFFSVMDKLTKQYGLEKLKTIGDSYMCAGGIPTPNKTHAFDACMAGLEITRLLLQSRQNSDKDTHFWEIRVGVHTGSIVAGVIGETKFSYDVWGDAVNVASRMESAGSPMRVNISQATYEVVKKVFECEVRGKIPVKGRGEVEMYFLNRLKPEYAEDEAGYLPNSRFIDLRRSLQVS